MQQKGSQDIRKACKCKQWREGKEIKSYTEGKRYAPHIDWLVRATTFVI